MEVGALPVLSLFFFSFLLICTSNQTNVRFLIMDNCSLSFHSIEGSPLYLCLGPPFFFLKYFLSLIFLRLIKEFVTISSQSRTLTAQGATNQPLHFSPEF